jgi:hypothetical protein
MPYNTTEDVYNALGLVKTDYPQSQIEAAIQRANEQLLAFAPVDDSDRQTRLEPIRKQAELWLACAETFAGFANTTFLEQPSVRILAVLGFSAGADFPTPDIVLAAIDRKGQYYSALGERLLRKIQPITTTIRAGS